MKALILAAGFGTRLYPLTKNTPKALVDINNKPLIEYVIKQLEEIEDTDKIYILSNNKFYADFLEWLDKYKEKSKIKILNNGVNEDYGKKGAIDDFKFSLSFIEQEDIFLIASDNISEFNLQSLVNLSKHKNSSTVALKTTEDKEVIKRCNHILLNHEGKIIFYEEKPKEPKSNIFSTACYFLKKEDVKKIKNHEFQNTDNFGEIITFLHKQSDVYGKLFENFWADIGSIEELEKVREYFKYKKIP